MEAWQVRITNERLQQLIQEEVGRAFSNTDIEEEPSELEDMDKLVVDGAMEAIKSKSNLSEDADEVEWHLSAIRELFGIQ